MKRVELLKYLRRQRCEMIREGRRHSWWRNERGDRRSAIPRHREIDDLLARKICRDLGVRTEIKGNKGEMNRDEVLKLLRAHKATLVQRFGVVDLALFGSIVRDQATDDSDVDILVWFDSTSKRYFGVQFYIEDLLGRPVDLVTDKALREEMRPYIEREMVNV